MPIYKNPREAARVLAPWFAAQEQSLSGTKPFSSFLPTKSGNAAVGMEGPPEEPEKPVPGLQLYLDGLSREELDKLKFALNDAANATAALTIVVGAALIILNPAGLLATIVPVGLGLMTIGFQSLANEIDKRLSRT